MFVFKIYIARKITSDKKYLRDVKRVQKHYEAGNSAYTTINSILPLAWENHGECIRICLTMIDTADMVIFMPDWEHDAKTCLEYMYCKYIGKDVVLLDEATLKALKEENNETDTV